MTDLPVVPTVVYSPSQTRDFEFCQIYHKISREGWIPRQGTDWDAKRIAGSAFAAAMKAHRQGGNWGPCALAVVTKGFELQHLPSQFTPRIELPPVTAAKHTS